MFRVVFTAIFATIGGMGLMTHHFGIGAAAILIGATVLGWPPKR